MNVIPIRENIVVSKADQDVVDLAYNLWLEKGFRGGSPVEDLLTAIREMKGSRSVKLLLVPKRNPTQRDVHVAAAMRCPSRVGPQ